MFKKLRPAFVVMFTLLLSITAFAEDAIPTFNRNIRNKYEGFDFELWSQRKEDPVSMTLTGGGTFKCEWDAYNILFRTGTKLGSVSTYEQYGDIFIDYGAVHNITRGDASYLTVYGWTQNPLIEYYVVENYGNYKPPGGTGFQGTYELDGGTYELYIGLRVDKPSIEADEDTFEQYYAVRAREDRRTEGTISMAKHFRAWEEFGLDMGGVLYEISLCVEGFNTSGNAHVYSHVLTIADKTYGTARERPVAAAENEDINEPEAGEPTAAAPKAREPAATEAGPVISSDYKGYDSPLPTWLIALFSILAIAVTVAVKIFEHRDKRKG